MLHRVFCIETIDYYRFLRDLFFLNGFQESFTIMENKEAKKHPEESFYFYYFLLNSIKYNGNIKMFH